MGDGWPVVLAIPLQMQCCAARAALSVNLFKACAPICLGSERPAELTNAVRVGLGLHSRTNRPTCSPKHIFA